MILRDKPGILALLFAVRGSVLPHIAPQLLFVAAFATAIVAIDHHVLTLPHVQAAPLAVFGVALSLFLGFRNNAAHDPGGRPVACGAAFLPTPAALRARRSCSCRTPPTAAAC